MAEVVGVVGSIIAILQATEVVYSFVRDIKDAPREMQELRGVLQNLEGILKHLRSFYNDDSFNEERRQFSQMEEKGSDMPVDSIEKTLRGILARIKKDIQDLGKELEPPNKSKAKEVWKTFTWRRVKRIIQEKIESIDSSMLQISVFLGMENNQIARHNVQISGIQNATMVERLAKVEEYQKMQHDRKQQKDELLLRRQLLDWLSPLSFIAKREDIYKECFKETGDWLWNDEVFLNWIEGRHWRLNCIGRPMVGKTVLSSMINRHLQSTPSFKYVVLSVFLDFKASAVQTVPNIIGSLLKQLIQQDKLYPIPERLKSLLEIAKRQDDQPSSSYYEEIFTILKVELEQYKRVYIIVDGYDESKERGSLTSALLSLDPEGMRLSLVIFSRIVQGERNKPGHWNCDRCGRERIRMYYRCEICNGRDYDVCLICRNEGFGCLDNAHQLAEPYYSREIEVEIPSKDIEKYVQWQIGLHFQNNQSIAGDPRSVPLENPDTSTLQDLFQEHPDLSSQIVQTVTKTANGEFLTARLYMDAIKAATNYREIKRLLKHFPENTEDIYRDAIQRLQQVASEASVTNYRTQKLPFQTLGFIVRARRPLSVEELRHTLAAAQPGPPFDDLEDFKDALIPVKEILNSTSGLAITENREREIRLVHRTLEEYIRIHEDRFKWFADSATQMANACLTYLDLALSRQAIEIESARDFNYPFLKYVSQYWGDHVREAVNFEDPNGPIQKASLKVINDAEYLNSVLRAAWDTNPGGLDTWDVWRKVDKLHLCAWYGLSFAITSLKPEKGCVDVFEPKYGQTPLMYACRRGHTDVIRQLYTLGASFAWVSVKGKTAMFEAVTNQHDELVEHIVKLQPTELDINAVHEKEFKKSALMLAAQEGRSRMAQAILEYPGVDINMQDRIGRTAIYFAAKYDNLDIVDLLLKAGTNLELVDFAGRSPLRVAAERNYKQVVTKLLIYGASLHTTDEYGSNAIWYAAYRGATEALELMLRAEYGGDLHAVDELGQNFVHSGATNGHVKAVRLLIDKGIDPNAQDLKGRTPLHIACREGKKTIVSFLLEEGVDPGLKDEKDRTPKIVAWQYGRSEIVQILQNAETEASTSQLEQVPADTLLPIWAMARRGRCDLLLEAIKTHPQDLFDKEPVFLNTVIQCAIECDIKEKRREVLETILCAPNAESMPINEANRVGRTALHTAALSGNAEATQLLIDQYEEYIDLDFKDRWDWPALELAQSNLHLNVMLELIKAGATIDDRRIDTQTLFFHAVREDDVEATQVLLQAGVDRSAQNENGIRAAQIARSDRMRKVLDRAATMVLGSGGKIQDMSNDSGEQLHKSTNAKAEDDEKEEVKASDGQHAGMPGPSVDAGESKASVENKKEANNGERKDLQKEIKVEEEDGEEERKENQPFSLPVRSRQQRLLEPA